MNALDLTPKGAPKVSASVLRKFAGTNPFGEGKIEEIKGRGHREYRK